MAETETTCLFVPFKHYESLYAIERRKAVESLAEEKCIYS